MANSSFRVRLLVEDTEPTTAELLEIAHRARDARPVLRAVNRMMQVGAWEQFQSEGARGGHAWLPDKPETVLRKERSGLDPRTERRTRDLEASLLVGGKGNINRLSAQSTTFGTRVFYARFQGHKRRLLQVTLSDANRWSEMFIDYILSGNV